jgi:hypothetical protein
MYGEGGQRVALPARARAARAHPPPHPTKSMASPHLPVFVLYLGHGDAFEEVDVPAPARVCDLRKALRALLQLSGLQMARTELRVVAAGGPQPAPGADLCCAGGAARCPGRVCAPGQPRCGLWRWRLAGGARAGAAAGLWRRGALPVSHGNGGAHL